MGPDVRMSRCVITQRKSIHICLALAPCTRTQNPESTFSEVFPCCSCRRCHDSWGVRKPSGMALLSALCRCAQVVRQFLRQIFLISHSAPRHMLNQECISTALCMNSQHCQAYVSSLIYVLELEACYTFEYPGCHSSPSLPG